MDLRSLLPTSTSALYSSPRIEYWGQLGGALLIVRPLVCRHGAQNAYDSASKSTLENEFGTSNEDECMIKILENGDLQETEVSLLSKRG